MEISFNDYLRIINREMTPEEEARRADTLRRVRENPPRLRPGIMLKPGVLLITERDLPSAECSFCHWDRQPTVGLFVNLTSAAFAQRQADQAQVVHHLTGLTLAEVEEAVLGGEVPPLLSTLRLLEGANTHFASFDLRKVLNLELETDHPVTAEQLDLVLCFAELYADLRVILPDSEVAAWFNTPDQELGDRTPLAMLRSRVGERRIRESVVNLLAVKFKR